MLATIVLLSAGCGPNTCKCLEEANKEVPNRELMDKCRETFMKMDSDEMTQAIAKCKN